MRTVQVSALNMTTLLSHLICAPHREFDPSFTTVAKAWAKVPAEQRDAHFFATADFDSAMGVFQKVRSCWP